MSSSGSCLVKKHHHTRNQSRPLNFNLCPCLPCLSAVYPAHNYCLWAFVLHEQMWIFSRNLPQTSSLYSFLKLSAFLLAKSGRWHVRQASCFALNPLNRKYVMTGVCLWPFNWTWRQTHWWRAPRDADPPLWCSLSRSWSHARLSVRGRDTRRQASFKASCLYDRVIDHWWESWKAQFPVVFCPRFYLTDWCQIFFWMVTQACSFDQ